MGLKWHCDFYKCGESINAAAAKENGWDTVYLTFKYSNKALEEERKIYTLCPTHMNMVRVFIEGGLLAFDK